MASTNTSAAANTQHQRDDEAISSCFRSIKSAVPGAELAALANIGAEALRAGCDINDLHDVALNSGMYDKFDTDAVQAALAEAAKTATVRNMSLSQAQRRAERTMRGLPADDEIVVGNAATFSTFTPITWHGRPTPRRQWLVEGFIPHANVTMLSGDGGLGKTLLAMQLQVAAALGLPWLGLPVEPIKSLGVYCEDDNNELHRRMADIAALYGRELDALANVNLASRVGDENILVHFGKNDIGQPTPLYNDLMTQAIDLDVRLIILDSLHDLFGGNEIIRTHARQFVGFLRRLALRINGAVLLCAHPSVAGMNSGSGISGSTGWHNAMRSRLYLTKPDDDAAADNMRVLKTVKANYGPLNNEIELTWHNGVFVHNKATDDPYGQAALIFLQCLDKAVAEGRYVSAGKTSTNYAPKVFKRMPLAKGVTVKNLEQGMDQLFAQGKIQVIDHKKTNRHSVEVIAKTSAVAQ